MGAREIALEIARCDAFLNSKEECKKILAFQDRQGKRQLPEPWNGNIETAKYLFISSNPSYDINEEWPKLDSDDEDVYAFFVNRFNKKTYEDIKRVSYWRIINKWVHWLNNIYQNNYDFNLINKAKKELMLDQVCLTEVVHCKSKGEIGVKECAKVCVKKHLKKVISLFKGSCIIVVGKLANQYIEYIKDCSNCIVVYMAHPNAHGIKDVSRFDSFIGKLKKQ